MKKEKHFFFFFLPWVCSDSLHAQLLPHSQISSVWSHHITASNHLRSLQCVAFQWLLQRIWCLSSLSLGLLRVSVSPALVVLCVKGHTLSWRSSLWSDAWQYDPLSWWADLLPPLSLSPSCTFLSWWAYKVANTCNFLHWFGWTLEQPRELWSPSSSVALFL